MYGVGFFSPFLALDGIHPLHAPGMTIVYIYGANEIKVCKTLFNYTNAVIALHPTITGICIARIDEDQCLHHP